MNNEQLPTLIAMFLLSGLSYLEGESPAVAIPIAERWVDGGELEMASHIIENLAEPLAKVYVEAPENVEIALSEFLYQIIEDSIANFIFTCDGVPEVSDIVEVATIEVKDFRR